ncbi:MAG: hypothetical protein HYX95_00700, partial [Chloroflexi bacterium]|nr:hypothetical protein [Chloroflexota bacterium]
ADTITPKLDDGQEVVVKFNGDPIFTIKGAPALQVLDKAVVIARKGDDGFFTARAVLVGVKPPLRDKVQDLRDGPKPGSNPHGQGRGKS